MLGDIQNSIRWSEVNHCNPFQDWDKRKVTLYGEVVEDLEFDSEMEAEQRLYRYYRAKKKGSLLYENEYQEEKRHNPNKKIKVYFSWKISDKNFSPFKGVVEHLLDYFHNPNLEKIEKEWKFVVFFNEWIAYLIRWDDVIIKDEMKVNPKDYYPEDCKEWDPIPSDTINKMVADKLWIDWKLLKNILNVNSDFYCKRKEEIYKKEVFNFDK